MESGSKAWIELLQKLTWPLSSKYGFHLLKVAYFDTISVLIQYLYTTQNLFHDKPDFPINQKTAGGNNLRRSIGAGL